MHIPWLLHPLVLWFSHGAQSKSPGPSMSHNDTTSANEVTLPTSHPMRPQSLASIFMHNQALPLVPNAIDWFLLALPLQGIGGTFWGTVGWCRWLHQSLLGWGTWGTQRKLSAAPQPTNSNLVLGLVLCRQIWLKIPIIYNSCVRVLF